MQTANDQLDTTFAALADPTRRAIVSRLLEGDCTVSDLAEPFEMSLAAVSKHIALLSRAGLVEQRREGRVKWCRLMEEALRPASVWMAAFGGFTDADMDALEGQLADMGLLAEIEEPAVAEGDPAMAWQERSS
ncbi:ArsR/SmtB family transcription factor [Algicella marina]|uniref:Metalloregulator ArsR/SmtB family transcription factor n=1 Tax=Algicella marina TaxID=2683284 RepID=A0A6P1T2I1_9RHOB|nr:metalloregulator ArsR/SmtB family transcription factor [Algicella marina]QHQ35965.1 metalloregulator ArsR/SmtB family transcription factor [Algicella marina]